MTDDALKCVPVIDSFFAVAASPDTLTASLVCALVLFGAVVVCMYRCWANMRFHIAFRLFKDLLFILLEG